MIRYLVWNPVRFLFAVLVGTCYHNWSAWSPVNVAGVQTKDCLKCGKERARKVKHYNLVPAEHFHKYGKWSVTTDWQDSSIQARTCETCGYYQIKYFSHTSDY